jgi:hypothetical protein
MYVKAKMISVETIPGIGERGIKDNGRRDESMSDIFDTFKNLCKCHNSTAIEGSSSPQV